MSQQPGRQGYRKRLLALVLSLALVGILVAVGIWATLGGAFKEPVTGNPKGTNTQGVQVTPTAVPPVSPLLFGTNMGLFNNNDQVLNSARTRSLLQQMHTRIIRMPVRSSLSEATEIQAAQIIKSLGAIPLVILRGQVDKTVLADDMTIINDMNRIFGNSIVYYEYGNEEDLLGVDVTSYTNSWNANVPKLKRIALQGHFIGPVNFQYDRDYLTTFLQTANPRPNEISWHEYTCDDSWTKDICISHIDNWTNHINDARSAMTSASGTVLPIMITEWNYAPNAIPNDGKNNDSAFMSTWTSKALQTLAANRIFAAMQYSCTDTAIPLITSSGAPTTQGTIFQAQYQQMIVGGQQPPPATTAGKGNVTPTPGFSNGNPNATPTVVFNQYHSFSFEDGTTSGWSGHGKELVNVQNSTTLALDGKHSLQVTLANVISGDYPYVAANRSSLGNYPKAGQTITAYVYLPSNSISLSAKVFLMDSNYQWSSNIMIRLDPGVWNRLSYTVPANFTGQPRQLGIQFTTSVDVPMSGDVYIDAVSWS